MANPKFTFRCTRQFEYEYQGTVRKRDCGHCAGCQARMKRDVVARAAAESVYSAEVVVYTLTYAPGNPGAVDFIVSDVSKFLKRERRRQWHAARRRLGLPLRAPKGTGAEYRARINAEMAHIVYFGVGERGSNGTQRCHYHLCLFYSKPSGIKPSPRDAKGRLVRENRREWPFGFCTVDVLAPQTTSERVAALRYIAKYFDKTRGRTEADRLSGKPRDVVRLGSHGRAFGSLYIEDEARRHAQAVLPYHGEFYVEGMSDSRGKLRKNNVSGVIRASAAAAYREEWLRLRPGTLIPRTDFMSRFDEAFAESDYTASPPRPTGWRETAEPPSVLPPARDPARDGMLALDAPGVGNLGIARMFASGAARFAPANGGPRVWLPAGDLSGVLPGLSPEHRAMLEQWLLDRRGPDWLPPRQRKLEEVRRANARDASIAALAPRHPKVVPSWVEGMEPIAGLRRGLLLRPGGSRSVRSRPRPISDQEP